MIQKQISEIDKDYVLYLYLEEGYSVDKLSKTVCRGVNTIKEILLKEGIEVRVSRLASNKQFRDWRSEGKSVSEIAAFLNIKEHSVKRILQTLGIVEKVNAYMTPEQCDKIIELYNKGISSSKVAKELGISKATVLAHLHDTNTVLKTQQFYNKYTFNDKFFDKIDSEVKAYFLGYLYADGYNNEERNLIVFGQAEKDKKSVEKFKDVLNATHPISIDTKEGRQPFYKIRINSKYFSQALKKQGCGNAKTFNLTFPELAPELVHHFIRGYFDGDGSIWFSKDKPHISITGLDTFLFDLQKVLIDNCNINLTKLTCRKNNAIKEIRYGGINNIKKISNYLYKDATIYLERKYLKMPK